MAGVFYTIDNTPKQRRCNFMGVLGSLRARSQHGINLCKTFTHCGSRRWSRRGSRRSAHAACSRIPVATEMPTWALAAVIFIAAIERAAPSNRAAVTCRTHAHKLWCFAIASAEAAAVIRCARVCESLREHGHHAKACCQQNLPVQIATELVHFGKA
jgi:hypothetical protein